MSGGNTNHFGWTALRPSTKFSVVFGNDGPKGLECLPREFVFIGIPCMSSIQQYNTYKSEHATWWRT